MEFTVSRSELVREMGLSQGVVEKKTAISAEESRFTLNGAQLIVRPEGLAMVATDGHRLALVEENVSVSANAGTYKALLPRKAMQEILKLAGESADDSTLRFSGDDNHL